MLIGDVNVVVLVLATRPVVVVVVESVFVINGGCETVVQLEFTVVDVAVVLAETVEVNEDRSVAEEVIV